MIHLLSFLKELVSVPGLSGYESPMRDMIEAAWQPLTDETHFSRLGSLHGLRRGVSRQPRPTLLLAAHMDPMGLMVSEMQGGLLRLTRMGMMDPRILPGQLVIVHGREDLPGVVILPPAHLVTSDAPLEIEHEDVMVDLGFPAERVERLVKLGDLVSYAQPPLEMSGDFLAGHSLDNHASVATLTGCLMALKDRTLNWDVCALAATQEEAALSHAQNSACASQAAAAVAIEVTIGRGPGSLANETCVVGGGPTLGRGPNVHPALHQRFKKLAERMDIPIQVETMPRPDSPKDSVLQIAQSGTPSMVIGIPLRNTHAPVDIVSLQDIEHAARLLAEFAVLLEGDSLEQAAWDT